MEVEAEVVNEVAAIFIDAEVQEVPEYWEIREEFEIIDKVYITEELIRAAEMKIAYYLDERFPDYIDDRYNHVNLVFKRWSDRS